MLRFSLPTRPRPSESSGPLLRPRTPTTARGLTPPSSVAPRKRALTLRLLPVPSPQRSGTTLRLLRQGPSPSATLHPLPSRLVHQGATPSLSVRRTLETVLGSEHGAPGSEP